jgi:hypothetical protein
MRKVIASALGAATLAVAPLTLTLTATPAFGDPNISQLCSQNADFELSHGACVSILQSNGQSSAIFPALCKQIQQQHPEAFNATFENLGDCVSLLTNQRPSPTPTTSPTPTPSPSPTPNV